MAAGYNFITHAESTIFWNESNGLYSETFETTESGDLSSQCLITEDIESIAQKTIEIFAGWAFGSLD